MRVLLMAVAALALASCIGLEQEDLPASLDLPPNVSPELVAAAMANLSRLPLVTGADPRMFVDALVAEYRGRPELLQRRLEVLASVEFAGAGPTPGVTPPRPSPFGGLTDDQLDTFMRNQESAIRHVAEVASGSAAVRPLSVCETKFLAAISKGPASEIDPGGSTSACGAIVDWDAYARAYATYAEHCGPDLDEWYAYQAEARLGGRWLESSVAREYAARMHQLCDRRNASPECPEWAQDRIGHRQRKNAELALRTLFYDPDPALRLPTTDGGFTTLAESIGDPSSPGILVEDRNADGIGEWVAPSDLRLRPAAVLRLPAGTLIRLDRSVTATLAVDDLESLPTRPAGTRVHLDPGTHVRLGVAQERPSESTEPLAVGRDVRIEGAEVRLDDGSRVWLSDFPLRLDEVVRLQVAGPVTRGEVNPWETEPGQPTKLRALIPLISGEMVPAEVALADVGVYHQVDPRWDRTYLNLPDLGLSMAFAGGCGEPASPDACPLLERLRTLIDRNQDHDATFAGIVRDTSALATFERTNTLVPAHLTVRSALYLDGAVQGPLSVHVVRVPYRELLSNSETGAGHVLTVQDVAAGATLDLTRVWLDEAALSTNRFAYELRVSLLGAVPADHIDGILLLGRREDHFVCQ